MRLTKDLGHGIYTVGDKLIDGYTMFGEPISKLGKLEDIEEELGIDLIILFKALQNGFYYKHYLKGDIVFDNGTYNRISLYDNGINIDLDEGWFYFMYKDYGKTWALDKKDLTNE